MNKSNILVTCGGIAGDIRQELGPARAQVKKFTMVIRSVPTATSLFGFLKTMLCG